MVTAAVLEMGTRKGNGKCIRLVAGARVVSSPCYRVGEAECCHTSSQQTESQKSVFDKYHVCEFGELHRGIVFGISRMSVERVW